MTAEFIRTGAEEVESVRDHLLVRVRDDEFEVHAPDDGRCVREGTRDQCLAWLRWLYEDEGLGQ